MEFCCAVHGSWCTTCGEEIQCLAIIRRCGRLPATMCCVCVCVVLTFVIYSNELLAYHYIVIHYLVCILCLYWSFVISGYFTT